MKEIPLTQGKIALVDDEDYDIFRHFKWYAIRHHGNFYARRNVHIAEKDRRGYITLHNAIMNPPADYVVDHIDGNGLNCCRNNLRICTKQQNSFNRKSHSDSTSKYKGVVRMKWLAHITKDGKKIYLGHFDNEVEAARAYDRAARELFGEFARLNFPEGDIQNDNDKH